MKLLNFNGYGIRGYQEQHISFREGMTFLIGINGSGKTTVLNLIQGLLRPSYRILDSIDFDNIQVTFDIEDNHKQVTVSCVKTKEELNLSLLTEDGETCLPYRRLVERTPELDDEDRNEMYIQLCEDFDSQPLCRSIAQYKAPMFLTLDRLPQDIDRRMFVHRIHPRRAMMLRGGIDTCLVAIQDAIYNQYRINSSKQNKLIVNLRNTIVTKSLSFMADDYISKTHNFEDMVKGMSTISQREREFMEVMDGLDIPGIKETTSEFFSRLKAAADVIMAESGNKYTNDEKSQALTRWVFSQSQLQRVEEISKLGHEYQDKVAKLQEPMFRFVECVNMFFEECGKRFLLDQSGKMKVLCPKATSRRIINEVTELSSGEKQIVAMLGSLIFLRDDKDPEVYFIDEPEVSLHLSWQDIFVDALLKACPKYQFVLATHSPNIISKEERRSWCEDLSPKYLKDGVR